MPEGVGRPYAGKFDDGWDAYRERTFARQKELGIVPADCELSRHDPDVPDWDSLGDDQRRLYAREMEVFAGFLSHTDHHIGRLIEFLRTIDQLDNTLIMVVSDNGASAEGGVTGTTNEARFFNNVPGTVDDDLKVIDELGGPKHFNHYPWGWTFAGNTPFRRWKRETYRGGSSDPFLMQWPARITSGGEIRTQYAHIIDMVPTVLDLLGLRVTRHHQGRPPVADPGRELRPHPRRRGGRDEPPHPVLRDDRPSVDLPRRLAGRVPVARPVLRGSEATPSARRSQPTPSANSTPPGGSSTTSTRTSPRPRTSPPTTATA